MRTIWEKGRDTLTELNNAPEEMKRNSLSRSRSIIIDEESSIREQKGEFTINDRVEVRAKPGAPWQPGVVLHVLPDGRPAILRGCDPPTNDPQNLLGLKAKSARPFPSVRSMERSADGMLPLHLTLGLTVYGICDLLDGLRGDVVQQANALIPTDLFTGKPKYPPNDTFNGYVNKLLIKEQSKADGLSYCERLQRAGSKDVGKATVFVSWYLGTPVADLYDALCAFLVVHRLPGDTKFWIGDFCLRQTDLEEKLDRSYTSLCVKQTDTTVVILAGRLPNTRRADAVLTAALNVFMRAWIIREITYTQEHRHPLVMGMGDKVRDAFLGMLVEDFASVARMLTDVDVALAECRRAKDKEEIMRELEERVGVEACNRLVTSALRSALLEEGRRALAALPPHERATSKMLRYMGRFLKDSGKYEEARAVLEEALDARRSAFGDGDLRTLVSMHSLGGMLQKMGDLEGARKVTEEDLVRSRMILGEAHPHTLVAMNSMSVLLMNVGSLEEAKDLSEEALTGLEAVLGEAAPATLTASNDRALLLMNMGHLESALQLSERAVAGMRKALGDASPDTLGAISNLGVLLMNTGDVDGARHLCEEALAGRQKALGVAHPDTLQSVNNMGVLLKELGDLEGARGLLEEALVEQRRILGNDHPSTLQSVNNMGQLLQDRGEAKDLESARILCEEALAGRRRVLGDAHPDTLNSLFNLADLLKDMGRVSEAVPLFREELTGMRERHGAFHEDTLISARNLQCILVEQGDEEAANELKVVHGLWFY